MPLQKLLWMLVRRRAQSVHMNPAQASERRLQHEERARLEGSVDLVSLIGT